jgi:uncharacterized surface protein with fasciclin (FAS1) repeats
MNMRTSLLGWLAILVLVLGVVVPQPTAAQQPQQAPASAPKDIVITATEAGTFKTLLKAVETAGLAQTLKGPGPFTVFAPTDEAFAKLPAGALDTLMQDKQKLATFVNYHVLNGRVLAADVAKMKSAKTVSGEVAISQKEGAVMVENAKVIKTDVLASNGVIHVVDTVIQPKSP